MPSVVIAGFPIDACRTVTPIRESEVTDDPVESGSNITDNVVARPLMLGIDGIVSNATVGPIETSRNTTTNPSEDAHALLDLLWRERRIFTIETPTQVYQNMVVQSITNPETNLTGSSYEFSATFKQIRIVNTERTQTRVVVPRAQKRRKIGHQAAKPTFDNETPESRRLTGAQLALLQESIEVNRQQSVSTSGVKESSFGQSLPVAPGQKVNSTLQAYYPVEE